MSDYQPSDKVRTALAAWQDAVQAEEAARHRLRAAVADDLKANPHASNDDVAEHLPWSSETVRGIAREYEVPRKRNPTVVSKRAAPPTTSS